MTLLPADRLTGHYTNLGEVVEGREVLTRLEVGGDGEGERESDEVGLHDGPYGVSR